MFIYSSMCIHIFINMDVCNDTRIQKYTHTNTTCSCCGTSQRCGVGSSDWVFLFLPPYESVITEFPWHVHHWNQHVLALKRGVCCKLVFEIIPIVDELVGGIEHVAQYCT